MRRATLRMPSDEALRVTRVCTLPLLHFSPSRVTVSHDPSRTSCLLAVPPPHFVAPFPPPDRPLKVVSKKDATTGSSCPCGSHNSRIFASRCLGSPRSICIDPVDCYIDLFTGGHRAILRSGRNPSDIHPLPFSCSEEQASSRRHGPHRLQAIDVSSEFRRPSCLLALRLPFSPIPQRFPRHFLRVLS